MHSADHNDLTAARDSLLLFLGGRGAGAGDNGTPKITVRERTLEVFQRTACDEHASDTSTKQHGGPDTTPTSVGDYQLLRCTKSGPCVPVLEPKWDPQTTRATGPREGRGGCLNYHWVGALV